MYINIDDFKNLIKEEAMKKLKENMLILDPNLIYEKIKRYGQVPKKKENLILACSDLQNLNLGLGERGSQIAQKVEKIK